MLFLIVAGQGSQHVESLLSHCTNEIELWYPNEDLGLLKDALDVTIFIFLVDKPSVNIQVGRFNGKDS